MPGIIKISFNQVLEFLLQLLQHFLKQLANNYRFGVIKITLYGMSEDDKESGGFVLLNIFVGICSLRNNLDLLAMILNWCRSVFRTSLRLWKNNCVLLTG